MNPLTNTLYLLVYHIMQSYCTPPGNMHTFDILDTTAARIQFDPYVSILDLYNHSRYDVDYLITLVTKVSSRFTKFYIELHPVDLHENTSLRLSLKAIARYNCLPATHSKIDVLLVISRIDCKCQNLTTSRSAAVILTDETNQLCNDTINTIVLHQDLFKDCKSSKKACKREKLVTLHVEESAFLRYNWGILSTYRKFCNETQIFSAPFKPEVVVVKYVDMENLLRNEFPNCKTYNANFLERNQIIKRFSISDTDAKNIVNMTHFVLTWKNLLEKMESELIISKAFDTPYFHQLNGWWYLENDSDNPNNYTFKEKLDVYREIDYEEDPRNFDWLRQEKQFDKNATGIVFTGKIDLQILSKEFCRLLYVEGWYSSSSLLRSISIPELQKNCGHNWQTILVISDIEKGRFDKMPWMLSRNVIILAQVTLVFNELKFNRHFRDNLLSHGYKFGYFLSTEICVKSLRVQSDAMALSEMFGDPESEFYVFRFEETVKLFQLGARRLFRQRVVIFNQCKKLIAKYRNQSIQVGFSMQRYYPGEKFHKTPQARQNFVKYVDLLNDWAKHQTNVVVFIGLDSDGIRKDRSRILSYPSLGWYSYDEENNKFITKREEALKMSILYFMDSQLGLTTTQIVIIVCGSVVSFLSALVLAAYTIWRYYEKKSLSEIDIDEFFNGSNSINETDVYKAPYDKEKYEISADQFELEENKVLGFGEFGRVYHGTVSVEGDPISVAIKALNPINFHKTTLHGMLSEIKVLAYLGKHQNIIQLLGANTANLRKGKVYIFLELCPLGSLEKRLREIRLSLHNINNTSVYINIGSVMNCTNRDHNKLDSTKLTDFYRWSTEICNGMAYLAEKHVVHADLATRNILLSMQNEVRICDFGLSRRMYNYTNYVKTGQEPLPWKWMAPECLRCMEFSEKSDVWAYGITLWEIYSLGSSPYPGLSWEVDFPTKLESGFRLQQPEYNEENMYELMQICWKTQPIDRPSFSQIHSSLTKREVNEVNSYAIVL